MSKQLKKFIVRTLLLSVFFVIVFNIWYNFLNANWVTKKDAIKVENTTTFKKINNSSVWKTGVAISTNMWIRYTQRKENSATIYKDIFSISEILSNKETANRELIWSNMITLDEYRNILKTNVKQLLDSSYDKPRILNAFIEQLEFRYVLSAKNIKRLNEQKTVFLNNMDSSNKKIETLKIKIAKDFENNNSVWSLENINTYLKLKEEFYYSRTYIVYINHFLNEYVSLNNYNKKLLDTLINNKDALIKDAFVVIPDSWAELLKSFNLIYDENEIKKD